MGQYWVMFLFVLWAPLCLPTCLSTCMFVYLSQWQQAEVHGKWQIMKQMIFKQDKTKRKKHVQTQGPPRYEWARWQDWLSWHNKWWELVWRSLASIEVGVDRCRQESFIHACFFWLHPGVCVNGYSWRKRMQEHWKKSSAWCSQISKLPSVGAKHEHLLFFYAPHFPSLSTASSWLPPPRCFTA